MNQTSKLQADTRHVTAYPTALSEPEQAQLRARRALVNGEIAGQPAGSGPAPIADDAPAVGFALSGGGIRSATFCLGLFQALAARRLIRRIDYLSTVSGGGYFGGFLGRLFGQAYASPATVEKLLDPKDGELLWEDPAAPERPAALLNPVAWLRQNGRYMAPNGGGDLLTAAAVALRNLIGMHLITASAVLLLLLMMQLPLIAVERFITRTEPLPFGRWLFGCNGLLTPSPLLELLPLMLVVLIIPPGWAYWVIERRSREEFHPFKGLIITIMMTVAALAVTLILADSDLPADSRLVGTLVGVIAVALLTVFAEARAYGWNPEAGDEETAGQAPLTPTGRPRGNTIDAAMLHRLSRARSAVTASLAKWLLYGGVVALAALLDTFGRSLYAAIQSESGPPVAWSAALLAALAPIASKLASLRGVVTKVAGGSTGGGTAFKLPLPLLAAAFGVLAWGTVFVFLAALAHGVSHAFAAPVAGVARDWLPTVIAVILLGGITLMFGHTWTFLNRSSHASLYAARLTRTYLGASNPARHDQSRRASVTESLLDDDESIPAYAAALRANGGPQHFINVTINETASQQGKTVLRDRKGIGMAIGPFGLSAGVRHHALYPAMQPDSAVEWVAGLTPIRSQPGDYSMFGSPADPPEQNLPSPAARMSVGQWIAVSGAAFSTGLGSNTSLGMSLLFGFANVRLGVWWDSGRRMKPLKSPIRRLYHALMPVQAHLANEISARFHGPGLRRWYLSDGGHFENMGAYELIRRRLPMIVIVDAEADPEYRYEGFANLIRKARLDFGAQIQVLDASALDALAHPDVRHLLGTLDELRPSGADGLSSARAALAEVIYDSNPADRSLILYIKPTLATSDPADIAQYRHANPSFPQQSTADQFFDEAQWESYRRLGEAIGRELFAAVGTVGDRRFVPSRLHPTSPAEVEAWKAEQARKALTE